MIFMSTFYGYVKRCVQCNAEFKTSAHNRKFCSDECRVACGLAKKEALKIDPYADWRPEFAEPDSMKRLREIAVAATKEGISYGQYMANQTKKKGKR